ncbi:Spore cortex-lytic enzyme [Bacillus coahuilensis m2-6]|nr:Spore cortex-lytic enzyme [Bacillus coahuilensis m2-6]
MKTNRLFILFILCLFVPNGLQSNNHHVAEAFSNQVVQHGAVGEDVVELQARLQYIGFYNGKIDGVFGWGTYWAVRNFQYEFGMEVDGFVGEETKNKLVKASKYNKQFVQDQINSGKKFTHYGGVDLEKQKQPSKSSPEKQKTGEAQGKQEQTAQQPAEQPAEQPKEQQKEQPKDQQNEQAENQEEDTSGKPTSVNTPSGFSQNDIQLMANAVYGEARGEPYEGQVAVAAVILNRVESQSFPNTVSGVIFEPGAFTAVADGQIWLTPNEKAKEAVIDAMNGWDPSENALYYFNPVTATSDWIWSRPQIKQVGKHIFCY